MRPTIAKKPAKDDAFAGCLTHPWASPLLERSQATASCPYRHYRFPLSSAEARRTRERNSALYPNGSEPRAAVAISMILS